MKIVRFGVFALIPLLYIFQAQADYTAEIFEKGSNRQKKLFDFQLKELGVTGDIEKAMGTYRDTSGNTAIEETAETRGSKVVKVHIVQKQTGEDALVEVKDGKIFFSITKDGKTKTESENLKEPFVITANFQKFVKEMWPQLKEGKTVDFRYGVWFRQETVGFSLKKVRETMNGSQKQIVLKMKPSSFLIAALVDPIEFTFPEDGSHILEMVGRVAPKQKKGDSYSDLDAETVYKY